MNSNAGLSFHISNGQSYLFKIRKVSQKETDNILGKDGAHWPGS